MLVTFTPKPRKHAVALTISYKPHNTLKRKKQFLQMLHQIDSYLESFARRTSFTEEQMTLLTHSVNPTALVLIKKLDDLHNESGRRSNAYQSENLTETMNFFIRAHLAKAEYLIQKI